MRRPVRMMTLPSTSSRRIRLGEPTSSAPSGVIVAALTPKPAARMACAYVRPTGIHGLTPKSVKKKMKTPAFAAAVDRDALRRGAEELGVDFDEHLAFVIAALEARSTELGLDGAEAAA